jgi:hypothetical protein
MHAAESEKLCIWRTVFFVRNIFFETSEPFEFDKYSECGPCMHDGVSEKQVSLLFYEFGSRH